jgi:hypothetical protein
MMKVYDEIRVNVVRLEWDPAAPPRTHAFDIASHAMHEISTADDGGAVSHLVHILLHKEPDELSYYIEVRQMPGIWSFDENLPIPGTGTRRGRVLVTRVGTNKSISNSYESRVSLFGVLDAGDSVVDAGRLIRITAESVRQSNPLVYRIRVEMNERTPVDRDSGFNLKITKWNTDTWQTDDIWVNSTRNDRGPIPVYESHVDGNDTVPILGDRPWVRHKNTIMARIHNEGRNPARDVLVTAYECTPPGIGDNGAWTALATHKIDIIPGDSSETTFFDWTPRVNEHTCLKVSIFPQDRESNQEDNSAQENVFFFR